MYIISKNKDYYDGVVGSVGMDKTIVYERESIEIEENLPSEFVHNGHLFRNNNHLTNLCSVHVKNNSKYDDVFGFIVGFCGKLYMGYKFSYKVLEPYAVNKTTKYDIIYGYENAKEYLKTDFWGGKLDDDAKYFDSFDPIKIFRKLNSPIFIFDYYGNKPRRKSILIVNPLLKNYEFYKVVDAFSAFTGIQMFISGVLGTGENDIIIIDDKYKIKKHGFDKWSFRKEPEK